MHPKDLACQFRFRHNVAVHIPNRLNICRTPSEDGPGDYAGDARVSVMDRRGNVTGRTYAGPGGTGIPGSLVMPADPATNRLSGGFYDGLGNQTRIEQNGTVLNLTYLDQGHVLETWSAPSGRGSEESMEMLQYRYYYDAGGKRRIKAKASDGLTNFQEDASYYFYEGESLSCQLDIGELAPEEEEFYEPKFLMLDHLGSTRAEITFEGTGLTPTVSGRYDYMPYGQFINVPDEAPEQVCFTGKPRDIESGLTFFGARYYNDQLCRWPSADLYLASGRTPNPQSWNRYSYCLNNPTNLIDPKGLWAIQYQDITNMKGELKIRMIMVSKSKQGDDAASLVKQLGIDPSSKRGQKLQEKINKQLGDGDSLQASKLGGMIGRAFGAAEQGMPAQAKWAAAGNTQGGPSLAAFNDCSMTACRIAYPMEVANAGSWGVFQADDLI